MRSLRTKLVMIMVILILALMCVIGAFLINGVGNFYISQFYEQMEKTFSPEFRKFPRRSRMRPSG